ncbi:MAG: RecX family transcriptional regulator [Chloroflexota bacterium]|jgi:regulatory protein
MILKITELKPQKRRKDRISVFLNGEFAFGLQEATAAGLFVGQELTDSEIDALKQADSIEWAKQIAYRLLSFRPRSTVEVRRHLRSKRVENDIIDRVIDRLQQLELLDDMAFARYWVEQRETFKPRSRRALEHELFKKGLSRHIVEQAVAEVDETAAARRAGQKKALRWANLPEEEFHAKMQGFLGRRGFNYAVIAEISGQLWQEVSGDGSLNEI